MIGGGYKNTANGNRAAITGGEKNFIAKHAEYAFIGGGSLNINNGPYSVIAGGKGNNIADGTRHATIAGGIDNSAPGKFSTIVGGANNVASGQHSIAMGFEAKAMDDRSLVVNLANGGAQSTDSEQFLVSSDSFTMAIGSQEATIDGSNIDALCDALNTCKGRRRLDDTIRNLQEQIGAQNEAIESMRTKIESFINKKKSSIN